MRIRFGIKLLDEQPFNPWQGFVPPLAVKFGAKSLGFERIFQNIPTRKIFIENIIIFKKRCILVVEPTFQLLIFD